MRKSRRKITTAKPRSDTVGLILTAVDGSMKAPALFLSIIYLGEGRATPAKLRVS
jgi:hypothetical protein